MRKTAKMRPAPAPWQRRLLVGDASLSAMLGDWIRDRRQRRRARRRESKGRWARE